MGKPGRTARTQNAQVANAESLSVSERYKKQIYNRFWMVLNHLTIPLSIGMIYAFTALVEFLLFKLIWFLLQGDLQELEAIKVFARFVQIAIAGTNLIGMLVHTGYSLYGTIQTEMLFLKENPA
jgi:hypothetical protein